MAWTDWTSNDDFIAFSFGSFDSKNFGNADIIYRTSEGDRYNISLASPMNDITADVPSGDGQYYFGTFYKPKVFNISFAFERLSKTGLNTMKTAFDGKNLKTLIFSEDVERILGEGGTVVSSSCKGYIAKVTGEPNLKVLAFDDSSLGRVYKGEGSIQFTAYWPYAQEILSGSPNAAQILSLRTYPDDSPIYTKTTNLTLGSTTTNIVLPNNGDIPTHFVLTSTKGISEIKVGSEVVVKKENLTDPNFKYWNSKTGIIKATTDGDPIQYKGDGLYKIPVGGTTLTVTHEAAGNSDTIVVKYDYWYY